MNMRKVTNVDVFFFKGALETVRKLKDGKKRFGELYKDQPGSAATFTRRLKELEKSGIIRRNYPNPSELNPGDSLVVYYELTPKGRKALEIYEDYLVVIRQP